VSRQQNNPSNQKISNQNNHMQSSIHAQPPLFKQVCVIGLGLIGASLAQAIKDHGLSALGGG